jgi:hydrogenase maturation factor
VSCGAEGHRVTCSDEAIEMMVTEVDAERGLAVCQAADGSQQMVEITLVAPVRAAERLLVHAGTAIAHGEGAP